MKTILMCISDVPYIRQALPRNTRFINGSLWIPGTALVTA
ncbi:hypothetical protein H1P_2940006 [Hyella patelloides LEGE 07179]|uniref:Uncharacterized protein n=1 Tax=Hyella patelloides LEGE 07179 TaxID=945734 RepID=A0A563VTZ8_9CYAN|nr:hypothetical protein H1P_2940006 [Hyella patelloides LEGE 07179]